MGIERKEGLRMTARIGAHPCLAVCRGPRSIAPQAKQMCALMEIADALRLLLERNHIAGASN
jgi:hypothetical protein